MAASLRTDDAFAYDRRRQRQLTLCPMRVKGRSERSFAMRGHLMACLDVDFPGLTAGRDCASFRLTKTLAKKTTVTTV